MKRYIEVCAFRDAAIADGWSHEPTYGNQEPEESACTLKRDGWIMMVFARKQHDVSISIWAPDGLDVKAPGVYNWDEIQRGIRRCNACGAEDVKTTRYSFAGRCCEKCLPAMRAKHEFPGWAD
jgi:hypothetical protein